MSTRSPKTIEDVLCGCRRLLHLKCCQLVEACFVAEVRRVKVVFDLRDQGPLFPVDSAVVDAVHLANHLAGPSGEIILVYRTCAVAFAGGAVSSVSATEGDDLDLSLRLARTWLRGARIGGPLRGPGYVLRRAITHGRLRWKAAAPPLLARELVRTRAIESEANLHVQRSAPFPLIVDAIHPSVAVEVLKESRLWPVLEGRTLVGQSPGSHIPVGLPAPRRQGWRVV